MILHEHSIIMLYRLQEQLVEAAQSRQALESSLAAAESRLESLQRECDTRGATIRWLEAQVGQENTLNA